MIYTINSFFHFPMLPRNRKKGASFKQCQWDEGFLEVVQAPNVISSSLLIRVINKPLLHCRAFELLDSCGIPN